MSAALRGRHAALTAIEPAGNSAGEPDRAGSRPSSSHGPRALNTGFVEAPFIARIGPILRHQRIGADARQERGLVEIHEGREGCERLRAIVDPRSARVRRFISSPGFRRDRAPVRIDLEQFIARLEGLPDAGPLIGEGLGAVGFAAMSRIGQRGPVERDEGAPGEIVEVGIGVGLDRGRVLDAVGETMGALSAAAAR